MNYRDIFEQEEWATLQLSFIWMFQAVAGTDGDIDLHELDALNNIIRKSQNFPNELARQVLTIKNYNISNVSFRYNSDSRSIKAGLKEISSILQKVEEPIALEFKKTLLAIGVYIANSSGEWFNYKMSNEETQTLVELSLLMKVSKKDLNTAPTVQDILKYIEN